jgi:hypothetical protein
LSLILDKKAKLSDKTNSFELIFKNIDKIAIPLKKSKEK